MRVSGTFGELRSGYQRAARLGAWTLELLPGLPRAFKFSAKILDVHGYWSLQAPLDIVVAVGETEWIWRSAAPTPSSSVLEVEITERPIVADRMPRLEAE